MIPAELRKWLAFGSGIGIEISGPRGSESLEITAVRVRPSGARVLDRLVVEDVPHQPAGVWGTDYAAFVRKLDLKYVAATVLLPRQDVIVRQLVLPGVSDKDLPNAIQFQLDGLHPYPEDEVVSSWARLGNTSTVLIAIARRAAMERYATMFAEAGVKLAGFSCSAAAIYSALRVFGNPRSKEILASEPIDGQLEFYGESPTRPMFSASFDASQPRAAALACSELRIDPATDPQPLEELIGSVPALPYAAALVSAVPRLTLPVNLLPVEQRTSGSRTLWIPTAAIASMVLLLAVAIAAFPGVESRSYSRSLNAAISKMEPLANRAAQIDREMETARQRAVLLDGFRRHSKEDIDVLAELTRILPPPVWVSSLEVNRTQVTITGEAVQAEPLLKTIDSSPLFESSEFVSPPFHLPNGELFRIRTNREAPKP